MGESSAANYIGKCLRAKYMGESSPANHMSDSSPAIYITLGESSPAKIYGREFVNKIYERAFPSKIYGREFVERNIYFLYGYSFSNAMEYEGCKRTLNSLIKKKVPIRCLTTDRHTTIRACSNGCNIVACCWPNNVAFV